MLAHLIIIACDSREARVGKDEPGHLADAENLFRGENAVRGKHPTRLPGARIGQSVTRVVNEIVLLPPDQHCEVERITRLGAFHGSFGTQDLENSLDLLVLPGTNTNFDLDVVSTAPAMRACSSTATTANPSLRAPANASRPGAGSAMTSALSWLFSGGGDDGGGNKVSETAVTPQRFGSRTTSSQTACEQSSPPDIPQSFRPPPK